MIHDLRFAFRALARSPVFTGVSVLMLGAGIGLAIFMFGAINIYALKPLPFPKADELVSIQYTDSETGRRNLAVPLIDWLDLRDRQQSLRSLEAYAVGTMNIGGIDGPPERLQFNADPNVVGRQMRINGKPISVIGVMPERFAFPVAEAIWMPLSSDRAFAASDAAQDVKTFGRLRDGDSIAQAKSDFAGMVRILATERSEPLRGDAAKVQPFADEFILPQIKAANTAMFIAVLLVLLIACANVASLVMARFAARTRELAVRSALGASRRRLIVQVLAETIIISLCATALGWLGATIAANLMDRFMQSTPAQMPYWLDRSADLRDVLFAGGIALLSALAAGLLPAMRTGRVDVQSVLRQGGGIGERSKLSRVLVAGEVALCMVLLVGSGIAIRSSITAQETRRTVCIKLSGQRITRAFR